MTDGTNEPRPSVARPPLWLALLLAAMAGGMGWGIRGQYGHETGAMIAGVLVGLVAVLLFCPRITSLGAARTVALVAIGISFGGSMTYGQTVGLTHDNELLGNWEALGWGLLGLALKGGIWVGFAGALLGMALGGTRYRALEVALLVISMIGLLFLGVYLLNEPFDPANRKLPAIYFSDHWDWEPDKADLSPRRERWGGLLFALVALIVHAGFFRRDRLSRNLGICGILAGAVGFPLGQSLQAYHAWNREWFSTSWLAGIDRYMNWWNMMEITFGAVLGLGLALGLWLSARHIASHHITGDDGAAGGVGHGGTDAAELSLPIEWWLLALHIGAVSVWNFLSVPWFDAVADVAVTMGLVPLIGVIGGRLWPYMVALPVVALPIAGKTLRQMSYRTDQIDRTTGWIVFVVIPMLIMLAAALVLWRRGERGQTGRSFSRWALLLATWFYFCLNFAFFEFPWPWREPTGRTPSAWIFLVCAVTLSIAAVWYGRRKVASPAGDRGGVVLGGAGGGAIAATGASTGDAGVEGAGGGGGILGAALMDSTGDARDEAEEEARDEGESDSDTETEDESVDESVGEAEDEVEDESVEEEEGEDEREGDEEQESEDEDEDEEESEDEDDEEDSKSRG